jgi:predicted GNAT superfamily acetyltransferase
MSRSGIAASLVDRARGAAGRAAAAAGVEVVAVTVADVSGVQDVIAGVWGDQQRIQANLLMAMSHAGATVAAAVRDGVAVGACVGFLGWTGGVHLHSHMAAVRPGVRAGGIGYALKLWQRAVCLAHGVDEIRWTFDPLVRRNAYFNLAKLGARVVDYRPDFYGEMDDIVNAGDHSDRFEVSWALASADVAAALRGLAEVPDSRDPLVPLPEDYDRLRLEDPGAARLWRQRTRTALAEQWAAGRRPLWAGTGYAFRPIDAGRSGW